MDEIPGSRIPWKGLSDLLSYPSRRWIHRHVEMNNPPTLMVQDDQHMQNTEENGRHREEIHRRQTTIMIF